LSPLSSILSRCGANPREGRRSSNGNDSNSKLENPWARHVSSCYKRNVMRKRGDASPLRRTPRVTLRPGPRASLKQGCRPSSLLSSLQPSAVAPPCAWRVQLTMTRATHAAPRLSRTRSPRLPPRSGVPQGRRGRQGWRGRARLCVGAHRSLEAARCGGAARAGAPRWDKRAVERAALLLAPALSTEGGTRRVQLVRKEGRDVSN
jgi:hypothetical protein